MIVALTEAGLRRHRLGLGDGSLYPTLLAELEVEEAERPPLLEALARRDMVEVERRVDLLGLGRAASELLATLPNLRGGPEVLEHGRDGPVSAAVENLRACYELLAERGVADRVIFDLGLVRWLGYYTGAVFEVYDPARGLRDRRRRPLRRPARALRARPAGLRPGARRAPRARGQDRRGAAGMSELTIAVPRGALFEETLDLLDGSASTRLRCARTTAASCSPSRGS